MTAMRRRAEEQSPEDRAKELALLAWSREIADPEEVWDRATFWLERWRRERSVELGRPKPQRCRNLVAT
jgi:hypothetical protein